MNEFCPECENENCECYEEIITTEKAKFNDLSVAHADVSFVGMDTISPFTDQFFRQDTVDVCKQTYESQIKERNDLIQEFVDYFGEECRFDHHGYCQEHRLEEGENCFVKRALKLLGKN